MKNLIEKYENLSLDEKRNEYNKEMTAIASIIIACLKQFKDDDYEMPFNYKQTKDLNMTEEDMLVKHYEDILEIKENLLLLLSYYSANK